MENFTEIKLFFWIGSAIMATLSLGVVFLAVLYQNRMLRLRKEQSRLKMRAVLQKEQEERKRISEDLHDTVSGNLSSINIYFTLLKKRITDPEVFGIISEASEELRNTQQEIRRISFNLMPPILVTAGFSASLEDFLRKNSRRNGYAYEFSTVETIIISQENSYQLLQIIQEMVYNSVRHGLAKSIRIHISQENNLVLIKYFDDGKIYDFQKSADQSIGYGLKNILSRIDFIGGSLQQINYEDGNHFKILTGHED